MTEIQFSTTPEFAKDSKRLAKKYPSLTNDLQLFNRLVNVRPHGAEGHSTILHRKGTRLIVKSRLMCRSLRGADLRIIYHLDQRLRKCLLIELYFKGDKPSEDKLRLKKYWG